MMTNWSILCVSIEHAMSNDTQHSEVVSDTRERPAYRIRQKRTTLILEAIADDIYLNQK